MGERGKDTQNQVRSVKGKKTARQEKTLLGLKFKFPSVQYFYTHAENRWNDVKVIAFSSFLFVPSKKI